MDDRRVTKLWLKLDIIEDVWTEILSRLPTKSLLQLRCVSKSWRSLIDNPNFCHLHLSNFKNNVHETHILVVEEPLHGEESFCVVRNSSTFEATTRPRSLNTVVFNGKWCIACSVDGLVLLRLIDGFLPQVDRHANNLMFWNPSIRRSRALPPSPPDLIYQEIKNVDLGFGFDVLIKDYKLVRLVHRLSSLHSIAVYTIGTAKWKTVRFAGKRISTWCWNFKDICAAKTVYFKGALFFTPWNHNSNTRELVSFDLSSEVFASISLPVESGLRSKGYTHHVPTLVDGGCLLGMVEHLVTYTKVNIWVLESSGPDMDSVCWNKRYKLAPSFCDLFPYHSCALDILYLKKTGNMLLHKCGRVISYNLKTHKEKPLRETDDGLHLHMVYGYKESLVLLNG